MIDLSRAIQTFFFFSPPRLVVRSAVLLQAATLGGSKFLEFVITSLSFDITLFPKSGARSDAEYLPMSPNQSPFDVHETHEVAASSLDSSGSSFGTGSHTFLIPESSLQDARSSSSHGTPTVKFAPLPQIDPNRKRSLAPLGVPGRSRRKLVVQEDGGSLFWSADPDVPEENMEDSIIAFAKLVKKTGKTLWRRMRKGNKAVAQEIVVYSAEPVLDIRSTVRPGDMGLGEKGEHVSKAVCGEGGRRRASWSPLAERRTLKVQRRSTSDLPRLSLIP
jgi:hypothetical protein